MAARCLLLALAFSLGCVAAPAAARKLAPAIAQYLLGVGIEKLWTRDGKKPRNPQLIRDQIGKLELELALADPEYAAAVRELRESIGKNTSLDDYRRAATETVHRIKALEMRVANLEKRADETDRRLEDVQRRIGNLERRK